MINGSAYGNRIRQARNHETFPNAFLSSIRDAYYKIMTKISLCLSGLLATAVLPCAADTFIVTTTNDTGDGSLRAAIASANATNGSTIQFAVTNPPAGVRTITPVTALPFITRPV